MTRSLCIALCVFTLLCVGGVASTYAAEFTGGVIAVKQRNFRLFLPERYSKDSPPMPLVIVLHGGGSSPPVIRELTDMNSLAEKEGFIVAYPFGSGFYHKVGLTWNAESCCGYAQNNKVDDVLFIRNMIDTLTRKYNIDPSRVYVTGFGNGAQMAYRLACEIPEKIAAIAPVNGQIATSTCTPRKAVPVLHIHGIENKCYAYNGSPTCGACLFDQQFFKYIDQSENQFACRNVQASLFELADKYKCTRKQEGFFHKGDVTCTRWSGCKDNAELSLCRADNAGHTWPGHDNSPTPCHDRPQGRQCKRWHYIVGKTNSDIDASAFIWDFFRQHHLTGKQ